MPQGFTYYPQNQSQMVYSPPQGNAYILQQNPYVSQQGPKWYAQNQYPGPQPQYGQNHQAYNPYRKNPLR